MHTNFNFFFTSCNLCFSWKTRQFVRCGQLVSSVCCLVWDNIFLSRSKCRRTRRAEYELQVVKVGNSAVVLPINIYRLSMWQQYLPAKSIPKYRLSYFIFPFSKDWKIHLYSVYDLVCIESIEGIWNERAYSTLGQKSSIYPKIHILKITLHKIYIFNISFFTKFTFSKSQFQILVNKKLIFEFPAFSLFSFRTKYHWSLGGFTKCFCARQHH